MYLCVCVRMSVYTSACACARLCVSVFVYLFVCVWLAVQRIEELEATLYSALQQEQPACQAVAESLTDRQREELRLAVDKLRRQILRQSRQFDSQILQERMELLQQAQQVRLKRNQVRLFSPALCQSDPWSLCEKPPDIWCYEKDAVSLCVTCYCVCVCDCDLNSPHSSVSLTVILHPPRSNLSMTSTSMVPATSSFL